MQPHLPGAAFTLQRKQGKCRHLILTVRPQLNDPWGPASLGSNSDGNNTLTGSGDKEAGQDTLFYIHFCSDYATC